ncbi:Predicted transporter component [Acidilobus saccharovorans 345-15]|uniref:Predicted transporter component n=1 Tax=Acidilobus saccharovorans (strain DSM 16705 / JCM 18335 / VKM B-2471 / 345-15) TaxID=666510 RepID=D9Q1G8_ACIS3|nr:Predicted transporter component [Acidilobus saccharovorans 345-15]
MPQEAEEKRDREAYWTISGVLLALAIILLGLGLYFQLDLHHQPAPLLLGILAGFVLATPLEIWNWGDPDIVWRVVSFQDRFLMVCFGFAIGLGALLLYGLYLIPGTAPHFGIKDFFVPGIVVGGLLFGIGVGLSGYFPGLIWISLGQGRRDAIYAVIGGLLGALTWSLIFGAARGFFWNTLNFGPITWATLAGFSMSDRLGYFAVAVVFFIIMFSMFMFLPRYPGQPVRQSCAYHLSGASKESTVWEEVVAEEMRKYPKANKFITRLTNESSIRNSRSIILLGIAFTVTAVAVIYLRQIFGESTTFSWIGAQIAYAINPRWAAANPYWQLFGGLGFKNGVPYDKPFSEIGWEPFSDLGTFLGALISSLFVTRRFMGYRRQVPTLWARRFGDSEAKRALGSFFGAYLVLFGARMANGCASGHILSGNTQMAISSFVFMIFVLIGAWITLYGVLGLRINKWGFRK